MANTHTSDAYVPGLSLFAQLLATEKLHVVVNPNENTAQFDMTNRTLVLPSWRGFSEEAWLLFICHEVGHALFTPQTALHQPNVTKLAQQYGPQMVHIALNLFEDARVERLMKLKYRGLVGVFSRGYQSLLAQKFFGFKMPMTAQMWEQRNSLDRLNLTTKCAVLIRQDLPTPQEQGWFDRAVTTETFDDVVDLVADVLAALVQQQRQQQDQQQGDGEQGDGKPGKQNQKNQKNQKNSEKQQDDSGSEGDESEGDESEGDEGQDGQDGSQDASSGSQSDEDGEGEGQEGGDDSEASEGQQDGEGQDGQAQGENPATVGKSDAEVAETQMPKTAQAADAALSNAAMTTTYDASSGRTIVMSRETEFLHFNDVTLAEMLKVWGADALDRQALYSAVLVQKKNAKSILAAMVSSFRQNQSAWQAKRVQVSKTGLLDPNKMHGFKFNEDLFLRRQETPKAQNHGFVISVDWSSSMSDKMSTVLWQTLHLIWFAEAVGVPVSVYAFSDTGMAKPEYITQKAKGVNITRGGLPKGRLMELYRSDATTQTKADAQAFLLATIFRYGGINTLHQNGGVRTAYTHCPCPKALYDTMLKFSGWTGDRVARVFMSHSYVQMCATPLYYAVVAMVDVVRAFREKHRVQQCISVWLTDGDDTHGVPIQDPSGRMGTNGARIDGECRIMDPRSGRVFACTSGQALAMLFDYHRTLTGATVVCVDITDEPESSIGRVMPLRDRTKTMAAIRNGEFAKTGLLSVSRKDVPTIGVDAYIVSAQEWWQDTVAKGLRRKVESAAKATFNQDAQNVVRTERLTSVLIDQQRDTAMRRFTALITPFMAIGRKDAK